MELHYNFRAAKVIMVQPFVYRGSLRDYIFQVMNIFQLSIVVKFWLYCACTLGKPFLASCLMFFDH